MVDVVSGERLPHAEGNIQILVMFVNQYVSVEPQGWDGYIMISFSKFAPYHQDVQGGHHLYLRDWAW